MYLKFVDFFVSIEIMKNPIFRTGKTVGFKENYDF